MVMRQNILLDFVKSLSKFVAGALIEDFDHTTSAFKQGLLCFVCSRSTNKIDGSRLFACSKCKSIFYCSKECQVADWPRHKKLSCVGSL
jgi:hypothetical protein